MKPAYSVVFLTTLIGAGQGLVTSVVTTQTFAKASGIDVAASGYYGLASIAALGLLLLGLFASLFHLSHPGRGWRAIARWRTSWLSKEVMLLPVVMGLVFVYAALHFLKLDFVANLGFAQVECSLLIGWLTVAAAMLLFVATGMIYASVRFFQEWHTPLTVFNFILMGLSSGFVAGVAYSYTTGNAKIISLNVTLAILFTSLAMVTRVWTIVRNANLGPQATLRNAIGYHHPNIQQKSMGFMAGSFNTKEFFHGKHPLVLMLVKWLAVTIAFPCTLMFLAIGATMNLHDMVLFTFAFQMVGLFMERWYFLADATHIQNIYYQKVG
ncbi:DMSO reductase anchor subunit [Magnetococcus marinus MC-1]|uniref:DMSO reductase anchor subunit n=1 Tax=Magnetococcus marinus (strain ATCC BAA-1437 / JCM 17883 / MC-1) TaxID=156889 RepID=A0L8L4_MAGMM|nr:DmsC/YnfH family molybdoenzyme membrane anchor subunit [Magnetococcus marinus]ABK44307.1 DMSO reductase anchor subunit [Magnetococcus marinus MC-1]